MERRVEGFIGEQLQRLERATTSLDRERALLQHHSTGPSGVTADEIAQHRASWDQEHRDQLRKIEEDRRVLADAWLRLESEQRQLVAQREAMATAAPAGMEGNAAQQASPDKSESERPAPSKRPRQKRKARKLENSDLDAATREAVTRQFRQIRNDVRKHAERRK